jgi:hypothetical protein
VTFDELCARLDAKPAGTGKAKFRCQAHDDREASGTAAIGKEPGKLVVFCHARCEASAILGAVGLSVRDLFAETDERPRTGKRHVVAEYEYTDEHGNRLYRKLRYEPKSFAQEAWKGGEWISGQGVMDGVRRVLYRLPDLLKADPTEPVFLCEGEKDAERVIANGLVATTNTDGAGKWRPEYSKQLAGRHVVVLPDNDDAGREHARVVAKALDGVAEKVTVLELPGLDKKGDVSDWIGSGGSADALLKLVRDSRAGELGFMSAAERIDDEKAERAHLVTRELTYGVSFLDDCLRGILPTDLVLLSARTGAGKTAMATRIAEANVSSGRRVAYLALEAENREIERRLKYRFIAEEVARKARESRNFGDLRRMNYPDWYRGRLTFTERYEPEADRYIKSQYRGLSTYYRGASFSASDLERKITWARGRADLIILDHLHYVDVGDEEHKGQKEALKRARDTSLEIGVPVVVVAHLRKADRVNGRIVPEIDDVHGSSDITKIVTHAIMLAPAWDQPPRRGVGLTYMECPKDRRGGSTGMCALIGFSLHESRYEKKYRLGRVSPDGKKWKELEVDDLPSWSNNAMPRTAAAPKYEAVREPGEDDEEAA